VPVHQTCSSSEDMFHTLQRCIALRLPKRQYHAQDTKEGRGVGGVLLGKVVSEPDDMGAFLIPLSPMSPGLPNSMASTFSGPSRPRSNSASHGRNPEPRPLFAAHHAWARSSPSLMLASSIRQGGLLSLGYTEGRLCAHHCWATRQGQVQSLQVR